MAKAQQEHTLTTILTARWEQSSRKIAELAETFPAEKLESHPVAGIRTPGEVIRHLAFWNQYVAASLRGKPADDSANELPFSSYSTKSRMLEALKHSSDDVLAALREDRTSLDLKAAELIMSFVEHTSEHYGQLVVYARSTGIVPPASRG